MTQHLQDCENDAVRKYLSASERYRQERARVPTRRARFAALFAVLWPRISHAAIGMGIVLITAIALIVGCAVAR